MAIDVKLLDKLYRQYGFKIEERYENVRLYLYEEGRYYGADIVPLNEDEDTLQICKKIKKDYAEGSYAVQIRRYASNEIAATGLYKSFFSYETTAKRIKNRYTEFVKNQSKINGGSKYEYINAPFQINNELPENNEIISSITNILSRKRPQLVIIEAAAGYGKTCTAFEVLKSLLKSDFCENPLLTELYRNRGVDKFRYILLDEIDREYPSLDSTLVNYEIQTGRIPLIIDGFDELLHKSEIIVSDKNEAFEEIETMLDTIGDLLKGHAKVVLTTRKTAIFAGESFIKWLNKWNNKFDVTRFSIEVPRIKDWLGSDRLQAIYESQIPVEYIANPVLLTYLRNLDVKSFENHLKEPNSIVKKYFYSLLEREIIRQELQISADEQYKIFKNVVRIMIELDDSYEKRAFLQEIIIEYNKSVLEKALTLYPGKSIDLLGDKLITHALLDRKGHGEDMVGFINDFVFGTFIGEIMRDSTIHEIETKFSPHMIELGATAYRVQNSENKKLLWEKIEALKHRFEDNVLFIFDITLKGKLLRNFSGTIFQSIVIFKIEFLKNHTISSSVFINCKFKKCHFESGVFQSVSFIECFFEDCTVTGSKYIDDSNNIYSIKCSQKGCSVLSYYDSYENATDSIVEEQDENGLLLELYQLEEIHNSQRIIHLMKQHDKSEEKTIARIIDSLEKKKIITVCGLDMYIEMNKLPLVKKRIGITPK